MRLVVTVPMLQGLVGGVFEDEFERQGFNVAVAEDQVGFAFMAGEGVFGISAQKFPSGTKETSASTKP